MAQDATFASRGGRRPHLLALALLGAIVADMAGQARATDGPAVVVVVEPAPGMAFAVLPAGCFEMGDIDTGDVGRVCVDAVAIQRTEVTNAQFRRFRPEHRSGSLGGHSLDGDGQPAVNVSWLNAVAFADWLGRETGRRLRLPTEAEWEYAARAGRTTAWPWGPDGNEAHRFANLRPRADGSGRSDRFAATAPAGSLEPNGFGLFDLIGNASEWVADSYAPAASRYQGVHQNPRFEAPGPLRVRRGGSFDDPVRLARVATRDFYAADFAVPQTGFRLAMEP